MKKPLIFAAFAIGVAAGMELAALTTQRRRKLTASQTSIDSAVATIREQDTVIHSAVSAFALVHGLYQAAIDKLKAQNPELDTSELDAATAEAASTTNDLSTAIAVNTPASDEVDQNAGGTGTSDSGTVVNPADADTTAVTTALQGSDAGGAGGGADAGAAGAGADAGASAGAGAGAGAGDAGAGAGDASGGDAAAGPVPGAEPGTGTGGSGDQSVNQATDQGAALGG